MQTQPIKKSAFLILTALLSSQAIASGYHFGTQSVSSQSTANSSAAEAADPSTIFYNAAGLTQLDGTQASINLNLVNPNVKYKDAQATYPNSSEVVQGQTSGKITKDVQIAPHLYVSHKINDKVAVGLGAYVPFGSSTEYDDEAVLRYNLNELGLQTIAIQPTVAFKLNEQHSFGVGIVAQHTTANLRQYANFGNAVKKSLTEQSQQLAAGLAQVNAGITQLESLSSRTAEQQTQLNALKTQQAQLTQKQAIVNNSSQNLGTTGNGKADGYAKVKGDDWGFGYNLSWLWNINEQARIGVNFRSKVDHKLSGEAEWHLVGDAFNDRALGSTIAQNIRGRGYAEKEDASVKITTPESLSVHGMYKVNPQWNVYGDITWTRHSRFNQANLMFGNMKDVTQDVNGNNQSDTTVLTPNWRNTYKVALGASYQYSKPLQLRFGIAYDQSPVKNANYRMSTLPDNDRIWLSIGAKYDINEHHSLNAAYSHIFIKSATANVNGYCGGETANSVACVSSKTAGSANFKSSANILGLQYTYKF